MTIQLLRTILFLTLLSLGLQVYSQMDNHWDLKIGLGGALGITDLRRTSLSIEGQVNTFSFLPQKQLAESALLTFYTEAIRNKKWAISLGLEANFMQIRQHVRAGNYVYLPGNNIDWNQFSLPILFSRYVAVGPFPNQLKVSFGPELSYYDTTQETLKTLFQDEWLQNSYARTKRINMGARFLLMWSSKLSEFRNLNIGLGINYDIDGPIFNRVKFYKKETGVYSLNDLITQRPDNERVYTINTTIKPIQYFFIMQFEIFVKKKAP